VLFRDFMLLLLLLPLLLQMYRGIVMAHQHKQMLSKQVTSSPEEQPVRQGVLSCLGIRRLQTSVSGQRPSGKVTCYKYPQNALIEGANAVRELERLSRHMRMAALTALKHLCLLKHTTTNCLQHTRHESNDRRVGQHK
jgi:hypothetical protein